MVMYNTWDYLGGGGTLPIVRYCKEHSVSETESVSVLR
jgi:hypothetical protein